MKKNIPGIVTGWCRRCCVPARHHRSKPSRTPNSTFRKSHQKLPKPSNPHKFLGNLNFYGSGKNVRNLRVAQSRHFGCPSRSRPQHWNPGGARCLSSASVAQMLAAASIKVMDALFGLVAQNDAETYINERFWDGLGVEIGACANFGPKTLFWRTANISGD